MKKEEFLRQLEALLSDISAEERADAMAYYRSYFEDAGEGNEASILEELESPQRIAESIKRDLGMLVAAGPAGTSDGNTDSETVQNIRNAQNAGTAQNAESGQSGSRAYDYYNPNANRDTEYYKNVNDTINNLSKENANNNTVILVLGIVLAVVTCPVWLGILTGIFGALFGIAVSILSVTAALLISGIVLLGVGIGCLFTGSAVMGLGLLGAGLIVLALGILALIGTVWVFGGFLPWACKGICRFCKNLFGRGKERAAA